MGGEVTTGFREPAAAERARTVIARATAAHLAAGTGPPVPCRVHHLLHDGAIALTVRGDSPFARDDQDEPVALELLDHGPIAVGESVRALVWVRGLLRRAPAGALRLLLDDIAAANPNPALLDVGHDDDLVLLTVESVVFADGTGAAVVDHADVLAARPDPFHQVERAWVYHLQEHHPDMVERLRLRLPRTTRRGQIRLVGLDRYGLQLKTEGPEGHWDHRVPFFTPVSDEAALCRALRALMANPFAHGLTTGNGRP